MIRLDSPPPLPADVTFGSQRTAMIDDDNDNDRNERETVNGFVLYQIDISPESLY